MKTTIKEKLADMRGKIDYRLRYICLRPSPVKRIVIILIVSIAFAVWHTHVFFSSIYNIGKRDAGKEFMEVEPIKQLELQHSNDSINQLKIKSEEYEYE